jgi:predicted dehydrogenase
MMGPGVTTRTDKMSIVVGLEDGSIGTVNYFANGSKRYPKEWVEVFSEGRVLRLENFRTLRGWGFTGFSKHRTWQQDKGHEAEFAAVVEAVAAGGEALVPLSDLTNVTLASFAAMTAAAENRVVTLSAEYPAVLEALGAGRGPRGHA